MTNDTQAAALSAEAREELEAQADLKATSPSGCRWCGRGGQYAEAHGFSYLEGFGGHYWEAPTGRQRLNRMGARRSER